MYTKWRSLPFRPTRHQLPWKHPHKAAVPCSRTSQSQRGYRTDGKQVLLSLFPCCGRDNAFLRRIRPTFVVPKSTAHLVPGSSISPLTCPHLEDGDSDTTRGFSKDQSLLMTGRCFVTAAISYPRVTQSSQARSKPHSSSARHRSGVTPCADGEWRPREMGATAGSQAQASTVSRSYPFIPTSPQRDLSSGYEKKNQVKKEITGEGLYSLGSPLSFSLPRWMLVWGRLVIGYSPQVQEL